MRIRLLGIGILLALLVPAASASAADQTVTAQSIGPNNTFTPRTVSINAGDTVTWTNNSGVHNVHFDDGSFDQPANASSPPWTVSRTFASAGTFRYYCELHGGPNGSGMSGTVWVNGPGYPRPISASPVKTSLAVAYKPCQAVSANRTHGPPLEHPSCNPPAQESDWLTVGTFDANMQNANSVGSVALRVVTGDPANPPDDADVRLIASVTDVRNKAGLADYTGELQVKLPLRITDKQSGPAADERATGSTTFNFTVPCATTGAAGVGSTCSITTTADAVIPGSVLEGKRAVWQVDAVQVFDGGSDGVASTAGNTLFASQALFVP
jgi:plastocyanin